MATTAAKPKRQKAPIEPVIKDTAEADQALREIAELDRDIELCESAAEASISKIREDAAKELEPKVARRNRLAKDLKEFATAAREQVFPAGSKTLKLVHGELNFRTCPPSVELIKNRLTMPEVVKAIRALPEELAAKFLREKPAELNKDAIKDHDDLAATGEATAVDWEACGLRIVRDKEEFGFLTNRDAITARIADVQSATA